MWRRLKTRSKRFGFRSGSLRRLHTAILQPGLRTSVFSHRPESRFRSRPIAGVCATNVAASKEECGRFSTRFSTVGPSWRFVQSIWLTARRSPRLARSAKKQKPSRDYSWAGSIRAQRAIPTRSASEGNPFCRPRLRFGLVWNHESSGLAAIAPAGRGG